VSRIETARRLLHVHRPREALEQLRRELEDDPESGEAWRLLVRVHLALDEHELALRASGEALRLAPDDPFALYERANALGASARFREALAACEEALEHDAQVDAFHSYRAVLLNALGRGEEALRAVDEALAIDPEDAYSLDVRIGLLRDLGRREEAETIARHALSLHPENADFHEHLGGLALSRGDARRADASFREALQLRPGSVEAKSGIVDALRARSPVYRKLYAFGEWSRTRRERLTTRRLKIAYAVTAVLVVLLGAFSKQIGVWALIPFLLVMLAFIAWFVWLALWLTVAMVLPLFLVGVWFDPFGRHALRDTMRARWTRTAEPPPLRFRWRWSWLVFLFVPYLLVPLLLWAPIALGRNCRPGRARTILLASAGLHPLLGAAVVGALAYSDPDPDASHAAAGIVVMLGIALVLTAAALTVRWVQGRESAR
jgi:hypothetical protein